MALGSSLFATVLLAIAVAASPVRIDKPLVSLPLVRRTNSTGLANLLANDQARARYLKDRTQSKLEGRTGSADATNTATQYVVSVGVGSPATQYSLLFDTGSSNTWVGAAKPYAKTSTSNDTGHRVSVTYGSATISGEEYTDTVTLGDGLTITQQSIGVFDGYGFGGLDGILGVGPVGLTERTLSDSDDTIPTVMDNLFSEGIIDTEVLAVSFAPATSDNDTNGELTFGGTNSSKYTGSINYVPITSTSPANEFWGIDESISYGSSPIMNSTAGIVDTGTTLILIASDAFDAYKNATGGTADESTGLLRISSSQFSSLQTLNFNIGGTTYGLTPNAQIWPRSLNSAIGGSAGDIYLVVNDIGSVSGEGLDFINGYAFLERFYSVFDTTNSQVGFATTSYTNATSN
ncbi:aspartic peptidase A1 [Fomitopsis serialis]|uniref:aspartic peptidase A1 n=1 Tax=Fomitopsis serialis TaxID=139415 RepID=UPI00200833E5|nr:aspartic peptidase A1 [Neoantrodia serialis]KAH9913362.1 aspartic peptidase A1 [Neoantrodia serialis]